jgi:hypothetical protein
MTLERLRGLVIADGWGRTTISPEGASSKITNSRRLQKVVPPVSIELTSQALQARANPSQLQGQNLFYEVRLFGFHHPLEVDPSLWDVVRAAFLIE